MNSHLYCITLFLIGTTSQARRVFENQEETNLANFQEYQGKDSVDQRNIQKKFLRQAI